MDRSTTPKPEQTGKPDTRITATPQLHDRLNSNTCTPVGERNAQFIDRTPKINHTSEFTYKGADTGYCSASKHSNVSDNEVRSFNQRTFEAPRLNLAQAQFDPSKYQERVQTPSSSSGWSCSASLHSNDAKVSPRDHTDTSSQDMLRKQASTCLSALSDVSSHEGNEFSLQNTKKVLNFEGDSQPGSLNEQYYTHDNGEYVSNSHTRQQVDIANRQMCNRSNSVDELEFDRPKYKMMEARSNSVDDLDLDEPRERLPKPVVPTRSSGHENVNNSASGYSGARSRSEDKCLKPKQISSKQASEMGSPINSCRLRPIRQRTRNAIVNIMENGEVCLEFVKQKHKEEKVVEVFVISQDGMKVNSFPF